MNKEPFVDGNAPDRVVSSEEMNWELQQQEPQKGWDTGFPQLDMMTRGFKEGDLVILSGLTGNGKSQLAVTLAKKFLEKGANSLFFSYELSSQELIERFGNPLPVFYLPRLPRSKSSEWIERKVEESIKKYGTKIVFIDHLHYLLGDEATRYGNTAETLSQMCRDFKQIARRQRVIIFLLAHVRKYATDRPHMQDIKDSSGIIQEADTVLIIHRGRKRINNGSGEEEYEMSNTSTVYLDKVRRMGGKLGRIEYQFKDGDFVESLPVLGEL